MNCLTSTAASATARCFGVPLAGPNVIVGVVEAAAGRGAAGDDEDAGAAADAQRRPGGEGRGGDGECGDPRAGREPHAP